MATKFQDVVLDRAGNALEGAIVRIYNTGTLVLATIWSDDEITLINQTTNPLTTDANGEFEFYVATGEYDITVTVTGFDPVSKTDVPIGVGGSDFFSVVSSTAPSAASGDESIAIGGDAATTSAKCISIGFSTSTGGNGIGGIAIGADAHAQGEYAISIGSGLPEDDRNNATGAASVAIGHGADSTHDHAVVIGSADSTSVDQVLLADTAGNLKIEFDALNRAKPNAALVERASSLADVEPVVVDVSLAAVYYLTATAARTVQLTTVATGAVSITLEITNSGGAQTITWPASVKWPADVTPPPTAGVDVYTFYTRDAGTTWRGALVASYTS